MPNSLQPQGLQHTRFPCPSLSPGICLKNSCPLSQWCYLTISSLIWHGFKFHSSYLTGKRIQDMKTFQLHLSRNFPHFLAFMCLRAMYPWFPFAKQASTKMKWEEIENERDQSEPLWRLCAISLTGLRTQWDLKSKFHGHMHSVNRVVFHENWVWAVSQLNKLYFLYAWSS